MQGKTVVASGATSGIGEAAVLALARMGARIVFVARNERRAEATLMKLETKAPRLGHRVHLADLSLMAEARRAGQLIAASEPRIDVLINNAGAMFAGRRVTSEGLELTFALNHMAYFVLTAACARRSSPPRRPASSPPPRRRTRPRASIFPTCRAPGATTAGGLTAAPSSPTFSSLGSSPDASPEPASRPTHSTPASSPPASARPPAV